MLVLRNPIRFAKMIKVNHQSVQNEKYIKHLKRFNKPRNGELPKNTLKVSLVHHKLGYNKDDFMFDRQTLMSTYSVYTFKRK